MPPKTKPVPPDEMPAYLADAVRRFEEERHERITLLAVIEDREAGQEGLLKLDEILAATRSNDLGRDPRFSGERISPSIIMPATHRPRSMVERLRSVTRVWR